MCSINIYKKVNISSMVYSGFFPWLTSLSQILRKKFQCWELIVCCKSMEKKKSLHLAILFLLFWFPLLIKWFASESFCCITFYPGKSIVFAVMSDNLWLSCFLSVCLGECWWGGIYQNKEICESFDFFPFSFFCPISSLWCFFSLDVGEIWVELRKSGQWKCGAFFSSNSQCFCSGCGGRIGYSDTHAKYTMMKNSTHFDFTSTLADLQAVSTRIWNWARRQLPQTAFCLGLDLGKNQRLANMEGVDDEICKNIPVKEKQQSPKIPSSKVFSSSDR